MIFFKAPIIFLTNLLTTGKSHEFLYLRKPSSAGLAALTVARNEIGKGEELKNNHGDDLDRYRGPLKRLKGAWCAAFIYYCLSLGFIRIDRILHFKRTHGARELFRRIVRSGMIVDKLNDLHPGDFVLWARGPDKSWKAHIGIVSRVIRNARGEVVLWYYIAGNEGKFPAVVAEHEGHYKRHIGFARIVP